MSFFDQVGKRKFALTIVSNRRTEYYEDMKRLMDTIKVFNNLGYETSDCGIEIQDNVENAGLHVHCMLLGNRFPYIKVIAKEFPQGIVCKVDELHTNKDVCTWIRYCHKNDRFNKNLINWYMETDPCKVRNMFNKRSFMVGDDVVNQAEINI